MVLSCHLPPIYSSRPKLGSPRYQLFATGLGGFRSARLAQEAEERCYRSLIKTPNRISEGPPRGGLSVLSVTQEHKNETAVGGTGGLAL